MTFIPHHYTVTAGTAMPKNWAIFIHGLFGRGQDWQSVAEGVVEERPEWGVALVDLRLHGSSLRAAVPHTIEACAVDICKLANQKFGSSNRVLLGHSLGGKVALAASVMMNGARQVWGIDCSPGTSSMKGVGFKILSALRAIPQSFTSEGEAIERLRAQGLGGKTSYWLAKQLKRDGSSVYWDWDLTGLTALRDDHVSLNLWKILKVAPKKGINVHFIKASESPVIGPRTEARLRAIAARNRKIHLHVLNGGHSLHMKNETSLVSLLSEKFPRFL